MMNETMPVGMTLAMGLICLLVVAVLILAVAALVKYLFSGRKGDRP
jgi:hypothetical protein